LDELRSAFQSSAPEDPHHPITTLVCIENSQSKCGGKALPLSWINQVGEICRGWKVPLHCDGSRLFNTANALKVPVAEIVGPCDSVSICLSKGLGAPIGSVIVGSNDFIKRYVHTLYFYTLFNHFSYRAIRVRKSLGGGMRQVGILAAAGLYALEHNIESLNEDHKHAKMVSKVLNDYGKGVVSVDVATVDTNLLYATIDAKVISANDFAHRLKQVYIACIYLLKMFFN
jgi:threonine aldolase